MEDVIITARATDNRQMRIAQRERLVVSFITSYSPFEMVGGFLSLLVYILHCRKYEVNNKTVTIR